jgi:peptidyl-prolyl cis-trans isomerase D
MFDFVHEKRRLVQAILLLVTVPFALWGVASYRNSASGADALATVDGEKITQVEFDKALQQQQNRMRQAMGAAYDPAMFERPEIKHSILTGLVNQRLLMSKAREAGLTVSDEQLAQVIAGIKAFQKDGSFDKKQYQEVLARQNMSPLMFEARVRQELAMTQLTDGYRRNGYASAAVADELIRLNEQQRTVSVAQVTSDAYMKQAKVDDAAVKAYYEKNQSEFKMPQQARVEYVEFSANDLLPHITVGDDEIKKYYEDHKHEFGTQEQRDAAHILIAVASQASAAEKQAARKKAERILQEVKKSPQKFAELAKKYSQDPGSARQGGDLGFFSRGMMVKPFDDAAFSLKPGEISGLVQSEFGFHIIKLLAIKPARIKPLSQVRGDIVQQLKQQKASDKFAELADKFSNTVYEQSDSLKPAAELVNVPVQQSGWLDKGRPGALPWNDKALQAVFSNDVIKEKRNSEAVEIAPNTLLSVRVLDYKPASTRPLGEVAAAIRQKLQRQQAEQLAVKHGQEMLAQLQQGKKVSLHWKPAKSVTRASHAGLEPGLALAVFQANTDKLPAYVGAEGVQDGGYLLARVESVKPVGTIDNAKRARYQEKLRELTGAELLLDYLNDARKHASIHMKEFVADNKQ